MIRYDVTALGLGAHLKKHSQERFKKVVEAIQETVATHGPAIAQQVVDQTHPLPVDRGEYRRGFGAYDTPSGAVFLNDAAHASIVEYGRRPGKFPPIDVIERWVRRKFKLKAGDVWKKKGRRMNAEARSVAFLVARKIARQGIKGRFVMRRVEQQLTPLVNAAVHKAATEG